MANLHKVSFILLVVGGLNWLLMVFKWDIATWGLPEMLVTIIYVLVGLSALNEIMAHKSLCRECNKGAM